MAQLISNWTLDQVYEELKKDNVRVFHKYSYTHETKTNNKSKKLSLGRIWMNSILPDDFDFINEKIPKDKLDNIITKIANKYEPKQATEIINKIQIEAFKMSSIEPRTVSIDMFEPSEEWLEKKKQFIKVADTLSDNKYTSEKTKLIDELEKEMTNKNISFMTALNAKATGKMNKSTWAMLQVSKGITVDIEDNITKINKGISDGYNIEEYYRAAAEGRNAFYVKSTAVRDPGYLARKVTMANANIKISEDDCKSKQYLELFINKTRANSLIGRYYIEKGKLKLIEDSSQIINQKIKIRSPFYCKSKNGICKTCYGELSTKLENKNIGILAGGAVNMEAVNAMMKMKHKAEKAEIIEVDFIKLITNSTINSTALNTIIDVKKNELIAKDEILISIDPHEYNDKTLIEYHDKYQLPGLITIQHGNLEPVFYSFPFNFEINLLKPNNIQMNRRIINMYYSKGETILTKDKYVKKVNPAIITKILDGVTKYTKDPVILLDMLISELPRTDSCHLEVIISNMFRSEANNKMPARLNNYKDPVIIGCKQLPFTDSWLSGLAFENINKSVKNGLVNQEDAIMNPIEKILIRETYRK